MNQTSPKKEKVRIKNKKPMLIGLDYQHAGPKSRGVMVNVDMGCTGKSDGLQKNKQPVLGMGV